MAKLPITPICEVRHEVWLSPHGEVLVATPAGPAQLFDLDTGEMRFKFPKAKQIRGVVFLPDQQHVVLAEMCHRAGVYSLSDGSLVGKKWELEKKPCDLEAFIHVTATQQILHAAGYGGPNVLDYSGQVVEKLTLSEHLPRNICVDAAALSPKEDRLAVAWETCHPLTSETHVSFFDWPSKEPLGDLDAFTQRPDAKPGGVEAVKFIDSERIFVEHKGAIGVFSVATGDPLPELDLPNHAFATYAADSTNRLLLGRGGKLELWSTEPVVKLSEVSLGAKYVGVEEISADGRLISLQINSKCCIFDFPSLLNLFPS